MENLQVGSGLHGAQIWKQGNKKCEKPSTPAILTLRQSNDTHTLRGEENKLAMLELACHPNQRRNHRLADLWVHKDIKFVGTTEGRLQRFSKRQEQSNGRERAFPSTAKTQVTRKCQFVCDFWATREISCAKTYLNPLTSLDCDSASFSFWTRRFNSPVWLSNKRPPTHLLRAII